MEPAIKSTTLYFKQGSSDKIYQASIQRQDDGYIVAFAYGRRGAMLSTGIKTPAAVDYDSAERIFNKLVAEKTAKGYTPGEDGTPYQQTGKESRSTGIQCQLLNPVEEKQLESLLEDPAYCIQEKLDGRRLLIWKDGSTVFGINRLGLAVALPETIAASAKAFSCDFIMDGEAIGGRFHAFDLLTFKGTDLRQLSYEYRYFELMEIILPKKDSAIRLVPSTTLPGQKREILARLRSEGREGVVFKRFDAPYEAGRPASGGTQFKFKFYETASFIVAGVNEKRSVSLMLLADGKAVDAGNVSIPLNHCIPRVGAVVECRYLYAFPESGVIFQPVYLGRREDITPEECVVTQLKYKAEPKESE